MAASAVGREATWRRVCPGSRNHARRNPDPTLRCRGEGSCRTSPYAPRAPLRSRTPLRNRLLAVTCATLVALVCAETALRVLGLPAPSRDFHHLRSLGQHASMFVPDPELYWRMAPGDPLEPANEMGLRGPLPPATHETNDFVVVCIGDSCTFGAGVRYDDTYGARLGLALQRAMPDRRVDVVLCALGGFSTHQDLVLLGRLLQRTKPDVAVFYTGLFNDYSPAIGKDDFARAHPPFLHLLRLLDRARETESEITQAQKDFVGGGHVAHPRVPLDRYRSNLDAMRAMLEEHGCRSLIAVLPPRTPRMSAIYVDGLAWLDATRDFANSPGITLVDPQRRFDSLVASLPQDLFGKDDPWPCFVDVGHPSVFGHQLIAGMLLESLRPLLLRDAPEVGSVEITCDRSTLPAWRAGLLRIGLAGARDIDRAWIGDQWIPQLRAVDDDHLELDLPALMAAGEHTLELRGTTGLRRSTIRFRVEPLPLAVHTVAHDDGSFDLVAEGEGPAGFQVGVWVEANLRATPRPTRFGDFALATGTPGEERAPATMPFRFDHLPPAPLTTTIDATGHWHAQSKVPAGTKLPEQAVLQAFLTDSSRPWFGALSAIATLRLR